MSNVQIGLLLGAAVWVCLRLETLPGTALLAACALLAGLPWTGANLGGSVTLAAVAGLWYAVRRSGRLGIVEGGYASIGASVGFLVAFAANRFLAGTPTHLTRFVESESGSGFLGTIVDRVATGLRLFATNPSGILTVLALAIAFRVVTHPPQAIVELFARGRIWRDAALVSLAGSAVAYLANLEHRTAVAALGLGFGTAIAGLLAGVLVERTPA